MTTKDLPFTVRFRGYSFGFCISSEKQILARKSDIQRFLEAIGCTDNHPMLFRESLKDESVHFGSTYVTEEVVQVLLSGAFSIRARTLTAGQATLLMLRTDFWPALKRILSKETLVMNDKIILDYKTWKGRIENPNTKFRQCVERLCDNIKTAGRTSGFSQEELLKGIVFHYNEPKTAPFTVPDTVQDSTFKVFSM